MTDIYKRMVIVKKNEMADILYVTSGTWKIIKLKETARKSFGKLGLVPDKVQKRNEFRLATEHSCLPCM